MNPFLHFWNLLETRDRWRLLVLLFGVVLGALLETVGVAILPFFVVELSNPALLLQKAARIFHQPSFEHANVTGVVLWTTCFLCLFYIVKNSFAVWTVYRQAAFKSRLQGKLGRLLLAGYLRAPYAWHLTHSTADIQQVIQHDLATVFARVFSAAFVLAAESAVVVLVLALLLIVAPLATLMILVLVGGAAFLYTAVFRRELARMGQLLGERRTALYRCLQDSLGGIKELKVLGRLPHFENVYGSLVDGVASAEEYNIAIGANVKPVMEVVAITILSLIVILLVLVNSRPETLLPSLALFAVAAVRLMPSANRVVVSQTIIRYSMTAFRKVVRDFEAVRGFAFQPAAISTAPPPAFDRSIDLRGVGYRYPQAHTDSLADIHVSIRKGQSVAFVGESGAGKTTLVDLILGLLKPTHGTIEVDGRDIHDFLPVWQHQLGYIPQTIYLSEDTLRANVGFGLGREEIDDARIWRALEAAQLADLVRSWPDQLDRLIGERGVRLSGGQRQRIGIARAFYHDPAILILDEATAALDNETESEIVSVLEGFRGEKTLMTIAHRLTTVQRCDTIFFLGAGRVIAHGSYAELQQRSPEFQRMVRAVARSSPDERV